MLETDLFQKQSLGSKHKNPKQTNGQVGRKLILFIFTYARLK